MTDVLCAVKDTESKSCQKVSRRKESSDGSEDESSCITKEITDIFQLRYRITRVAAILDHETKDVIVLLTCMSGVQFG